MNFKFFIIIFFLFLFSCKHIYLDSNQNEIIEVINIYGKIKIEQRHSIPNKDGWAVAAYDYPDFIQLYKPLIIKTNEKEEWYSKMQIIFDINIVNERNIFIHTGFDGKYLYKINGNILFEGHATVTVTKIP